MNSRTITILILLLSISVAGAWGQVRVTGHVFAEVVESADASFNGETSFFLSETESNNNLSVGNISISGKPQSLCSFTINNGVVKNNNGEEFTLHTISDNAQGILTTTEQGKRELAMSVKADNLPKGDQYCGNYNITFAYN
jgi:hypothetical protein